MDRERKRERESEREWERVRPHGNAALCLFSVALCRSEIRQGDKEHVCVTEQGSEDEQSLTGADPRAIEQAQAGSGLVCCILGHALGLDSVGTTPLSDLTAAD